MVRQQTVNFLEQKNVKITKRAHNFKDYANSHNIEILYSFNPELQLKNTESVIKNKLTDLLTISESFKFVAILFLEFKKIQSDDTTLYSTFY